MKLAKSFLLTLVAGALAISMTACSAASTVDRAALVNQSLAANGAAYRVTALDTDADSTVSLIKEAVKTYNNYKGYLENTDKVRKDASDSGASPAEVENAVEAARERNLKTRANFEQSLASFNARGIGKAYAITSADVPEGLENEEAVACYVASLVGGNAKVYVSDVLPLPTLDDDSGTYTGACTYLRYVYMEPVDAQ